MATYGSVSNFNAIEASSNITGNLVELGSATALVATTAIGTATAVPAKGFSLLAIASSSNPYYLLGAPTLGALVTLYCVTTATSHAKTVLTSTDGSINVNTTTNAIFIGNSSDGIVLQGMGTSYWKVKSIMGAVTLTTA